MRIVPVRALVAACASAVLLAALCAASASALSITSVVNTPAAPSSGPSSGAALPPSGETAAGAHPDYTTTISFSSTSSADSLQRLTLHLPPGMVANVNHAGLCSTDDFNAGACPADSQVGTTATTAIAASLPLPLTLPGRIFNIAPPSGSPAALGIDTPSVPRLVATIGVDPHDLGLTATIDGVPNTALGLPIQVTSLSQTLFGYVSGRSFFTNPTSCGAAPTSVTAMGYDGSTASGSGPFSPDAPQTPTDCAGVPFSTSLTTSADPATYDSTSAISFDVRPGTADVPRASSMVRAESVVAPPGVLINSALAARLDACTDAGFDVDDTSVPATCPPSSSVGTIDFVSPILGDFRGTVYFGTSTPQDLLRLFLDVPLFGAHIKISAHVRPDPVTGQITTIFDQVPQVAFTDFTLTFNGGPQSALVTPTTCGVNTANAVVTPWSGGANATASGSFTTVSGNGAPCTPTFTPSMGASVGSTRAGVSTPFTLTVNRPDRTTPIKSMHISLPPGLIGKLALPGLTQCTLAQAAAAACPVSSRVGSVTSVVGSGSEPPSLPGTVYLAQPKAAGDPASLAIVVPARLGPVDTGTIVVGARLTLRPDGGLDVQSDDIPALQRGIPLAIRQLTITLDRAGFMQNPSSCGTQPIAGTFAPLDGGPAGSASTSITTTDCGNVPFAPQISASLSGETKVDGHPALTTTITQKAGEGAIKTAKVTLPAALSTNLASVQAGCTLAQYAANACPASAKVADATAVSPLVSQPLTGPVWIVNNGPGRLPSLEVQLRGPVAIDLTGTISFRTGGGLITTFDGIPDLSLTRFELAFHGGKLGAVAAVKSLCSPVPQIAATFTAHSARVTNQTHTIAVKGCPALPKASASMRFRKGAGTLTAKVSRAKGGKPLAAVSVALPKGLALTKRSVAAKASGKRRAVKVKGRTVSVSLGKQGASALTLNLRKVHASRALAKKLATRKAKLTVTVVTRDSAKHRVSQKVKLRLR